MSPSPNDVAYSVSMDALMSKDPLDLTDEDIAEIVKQERALRQSFLLKETLPKGKNKVSMTSDISLDDLGV